MTINFGGVKFCDDGWTEHIKAKAKRAGKEDDNGAIWLLIVYLSNSVPLLSNEMKHKLFNF